MGARVVDLHDQLASAGADQQIHDESVDGLLRGHFQAIAAQRAAQRLFIWAHLHRLTGSGTVRSCVECRMKPDRPKQIALSH